MGKEILIIGIGGCGCSVADKLARRLRASGRGDKVSALAFDTDEAALSSLCHVTAFPMVDACSLGSVVERLGQDRLAPYFPCDWDNDHTGFLKTLEMNRGAGQWRSKALLALVNFLSLPNARERLHDELRPFVETEDDFTVYVIASLAGGTGSGLLLPLTLYLRKHLGGRGRAVAMLACPDIFDGLVSAEQRVKMAANAYAAMRELNAVDQTARDTRPAAQRASHPYARIRLDDGMELGRLFDTLSKDDPVIPAAPFDRVFLQDKLPGVTTVGTHEDVMASLLYPICCDIHGDTHAVDLTAPAPAHVFGALSTLEIRYPREAIVRYIQAKNIFDTAQNEWLPLLKRTEDAVRQRAELERAYGRYLPDGTATFAAQLCEIVDTYINEEKTAVEEGEAPLPRTLAALGEEIDGASIVPPERLMSLYFPGEAEALLRDLVEQCAKSAPEKSKNPFENMTQKRESIRQLRQIASDAWELLNRYYLEAIGILRERRGEFIEAVTAEGGYLDRIFCAYDHPALGLYALCALRLALAARVTERMRLSDKMLAREDFDTLPEDMYTLTRMSAGRCPYGRCGETRFFELATESGKASIGATALDRELLCEDITALCEGVEDFVTGQLRYVLLDALDTKIERLREAMRSLARQMDDYELDVRLALGASCGESNLAVNVGAAPEQKQAMQAAYWIDRYCAEDEERLLSGRLTEALADISRAEDGAMSRRIADALATIMTDYEARVSEYMVARESDPTALERMLSLGAPNGETDGVITREGEAMARRALRLAPAPLHIRPQEPTETQEGIRVVSLLVVSERTAAYVMRHAARWDLPASTAAEAAQNLLFLLGEYDVGVRICPELEDDRMIVCRAIQDLPLHEVSPFDELHRDGVCYRSYRKALSMVTQQMTQMWNPHLCRGMERHGALAYISPEMQKKREDMVAKALLRALMTGELFLAPLEDSGKTAYFCAEDGVILPVLVDEEAVLTGDLARLCVWLRGREARMECWSAAFDTALEDACSSLPALGVGVKGRAELMRAIRQSPLVKALRDNLYAQTTPPADAPVMGLVALAYALRLAEGEDDSGDALRLLNVGYGALCTLCAYRTECTGTPQDVESYVAVYGQQLTEWMDALMSATDRETAEGAIRWAGEHGCFLRYRSLHTRVPYLDAE